MIDGLLVRIDFLNILQLGSGICQQVVVNFQPESPCNVEIVLDHQIVNLGDRPGGGIFDGQDAVLAQPLINGLKYPVKGFKIHDHRIGKDFFAG